VASVDDGKEAKERGYDVKIASSFTANARRRILAERRPGEVVSDKNMTSSGRAHRRPAPPRVDRRSLRRHGARGHSESIAKTIHAHPTLSEALIGGRGGCSPGIDPPVILSRINFWN